MNNRERLERLQHPEGKINIVLDTDTYNEVDDQFALAYALNSPDTLHIEAVYAAPFFNHRSNSPEDGMQKSYEEVLRVLGILHVPSQDFVFHGSRAYLRDINTPQDLKIVGYDAIPMSRLTYPSITTVRQSCENEKKPIAKVLESRFQQPYERSHGYLPSSLAGLPRFESSSMRGEYPFVCIDFEDDEIPFVVRLKAFTPFIPLDEDNSGIPGAVIRYLVKNTSRTKIDVTIAGSLANAVGFRGYDLFGVMDIEKEPENAYREDGGICGLYYSSPGLEEDNVRNEAWRF